MTAFASILGTVPLAVASGASAKSRHSIGTGFIGGMTGATLIALFLIPLFYWMLQSMSDKYFGGKKQLPADIPEQPPPEQPVTAIETGEAHDE